MFVAPGKALFFEAQDKALGDFLYARCDSTLLAPGRRNLTKVVLLLVEVCIGTFPAFAQNQNQRQNRHGAPAPLIRFGLPAALASAESCLVPNC
jgi:hypothetical protein